MAYLATEMVTELTSPQEVMGGLYARAPGGPLAQQQHRRPLRRGLSAGQEGRK
jgi:hypothetical protein